MVAVHMVTFAGAWTALVTPFRGGSVDEAALRELVERQIDAGIDGLVPCGTTGESATLQGDEHRQVVRAVVQQARGRVPVLAGAGSASTARSIELAAIAKESGADGVLLVCPYYNRPTQAGLEAHFRAVAAAVSLPVVLYNVPGRTGCDLTVETLRRLADVKSIVAIKEAGGSVARVQQILGACGDRFAVLSGDDALAWPSIAVGATGVVSVSSNVVPRLLAEMVQGLRRGDFEGSRLLHDRLLPLHAALFTETSPGPVKAALALRAQIAAEIRLPLVWPTADTCAAVGAALAALTQATGQSPSSALGRAS